jgi:hypothetical protein
MFRSLPLRVTMALLALALAVAPASASDLRFVAPLSGDEEVPPVATNATGVATFKLSADETELRFRLIVAYIHNVTQAHIHCGAAGVNGPVVLFLYPAGPPAVLIPGRFQGVLASGTRTGADVIAVPDSAACPGGVSNFDQLIAKMRSGDAYVNVHTIQFPPGEIRGQIR